MQRVVATSIETPWVFQSGTDIMSVHLEWGELAITLVSGGDRKVAVVRFSEIVGFRFLDEGDLLEFWPACAAAQGWLFRIEEDGWFDLEASRPGFIRSEVKGLSEYFVASQNGCVSVLTGDLPKVEIRPI